MRRVLAVVLPALVVAAGGLVGSSPAAGQVDREDLVRGLVYRGLERVAGSDFCRGNYRVQSLEIRGLPVCTHGPDPAPEGVDVREDRQPPAAVGATGVDGESLPAATPVPCVGTGSDGFRVQLIYARASDTADGYAAWLPSLQQYAARLDDVFNASAAETGGVRHVRFVHDAGCVPVIDNVVLSTTGDDSFNTMLSQLRSRGYTRSDRKYLVWMDANVYCGIAQIYYDDTPDQTNASNGQAWVPGEVGRVDKGCWGAPNMVEAHELTHLLGGVQTSAPNATAFNHCLDNYDRLCYADGGGSPSIVCPDPASENRLDCNHDDYFSTNPPAGSYLATHWNTANSRFLTGAGSLPPPPPPPPATTSTTMTTRPPTTSPPPPTTAPPPPTTSPPSLPLPSAPRNLYATQPPGTGRGVLLYWAPPASIGNPPFTTYRIWRGPSTSQLSFLADVGASTTSSNDATAAPRVLYWYGVTAVSSAGQSPMSNLTRMLGK